MNNIGKCIIWKAGIAALLRFCTCLFFAMTSSLVAKSQTDSVTFCVISYNVENLFDCRHDSIKDDTEFLPESVRHWNYVKYRKKLDNLSRAIVASGQWETPALVALCEVENDSVLRDLTKYSALRELDYRYVMTHSSDVRGIDVALLYQRGLFKPIARQDIVIPMPTKRSRPTRDILYVSGLLLNGDTLDVFVCHFPSRSAGAKRTESYRMNAARRLKVSVDSVMNSRQYPQIIIMGDFNDYPTDSSIQYILKDDREDGKLGLHHLLLHKAMEDKDYGSYKYQGWWGLLDHIIISANMLDSGAPLSIDKNGGEVVRLPFLLVSDNKYGGLQPYRTYYGMKYQGGYSDHLPVRAVFKLRY